MRIIHPLDLYVVAGRPPKNLWHSCGRFTLEALFARSDPSVIHLASRFVDILRALGDVQIIPQKTRLVCVARDELKAWLQESHDSVGMQQGLTRWRIRGRGLR